jgi:hypothetical protein
VPVKKQCTENNWKKIIARATKNIQLSFRGFKENEALL